MRAESRAKLRVAYDTNLWVSMAIGGKLNALATLLRHPAATTYRCVELVAEIAEVLQRPRLQRFLTPARVELTLDLVESATTLVEITQQVSRSRDADDDYLLALAQENQLDYLVTGDRDLLVLGSHGPTRIISFADFAAIFTA